MAMESEATDRIVLLGDSLTEYWDWDELAHGGRVVNQGVSGDTSMGLWGRVGQATTLRPRAICLQVGINDLAQGIDPASVAENHARIWRDIGRLAPLCRLVVCSLMPIRVACLGWPSPGLTNGRVRETNSLLREQVSAMADGFAGGLDWLDLYALAAEPDGELPGHMTQDGVHLTPAAYGIWAGALRSVPGLF
jgi:lysophospholipase L1-like esterase